MAISNYGELKSAISGWTERSDISERIPDFIALAERRIFRELRCPANETKRTFSNYDAEVGLCVPDDYLELKNILWNGCPLERISDQQYLAWACQPDTRTDNGAVQPAGQPRYFARYACKWYVFPFPPIGTDQLIQINYWQDQSGFLIEDEDTNPILTIAPGAYLFGSLVEAEGFLFNDPRIPLWESRFQDNLQRLQDMADRAELTGGHTTARSAYC